MPVALPPWFSQPVRTHPQDQPVAVVGAGIAGCVLAHQLSRAGFRVELFDQAPTIAQATSANPAALLMPAISSNHNPLSQLSQLGYHHMLALSEALQRQGIHSGFHAVGVLSNHCSTRSAGQRQWPQKPPGRDPSLYHWLTPAECRSTIADESLLSQGGWLFPQGGWINIPAFCQALLQSAGSSIRCLFEHKITGLVTENGWLQAEFNCEHRRDYQTLILCTGTNLAMLPISRWLPLIPNRGQLSHVTTQHTLPVALAGSGYALSDSEGLYFGSTYLPGSSELAIRQRGHDYNLARLAQHLPGRVAAFSRGSLSGWVGIRSTVADRLPLCGELPDASRFNADFAPIAAGERRHHYPGQPVVPGLYLLGALGSRAVSWIVPLADHLCATLADQPSPLPPQLAAAVHPARLLFRQLKRNKPAPSGALDKSTVRPNTD